jgi:hypothetical protein
MSAVEAKCNSREMAMAWERGRLEQEQWKYFDDLGVCGYNAVR